MNPEPIFSNHLPADENISSEFGERLVPLSDGRSGLRGGLHVEVREAPHAAGSSEPSYGSTNSILEFIASDETVDRCDEVIAATGWRLDAYRRNPVFQNAHQHGDVIFTLGKALVTEVRFRDPRSPNSALRTPFLFQRVQFATEVNPMARIAFGLYKGRFLNAVSVGFIPLRWENGENGKGSRVEGRGEHTGRGDQNPCFSPSTLDTRHSGTLDTRHSGTADTQPSFRRRYLEQELVEVSAVGIPANPNALILGLKAGAIEKSDLKDLAELLKSVSSEGIKPAPSNGSAVPFTIFGGNPAVHDTHASASGVGDYEAQLLQLARDVAHVLRNA